MTKLTRLAAREMCQARTLPGVEIFDGSGSSKSSTAGSRSATAEPGVTKASRLLSKLKQQAISKKKPPIPLVPPTHASGSSSHVVDDPMDDSDLDDTNSDDFELSAHDLFEPAPPAGDTPKADGRKSGINIASPIDEFTKWDNGEPLTPAERTSIMALNSNYERSREMNIRRNRRIQRELGIGVGDVIDAKAKADKGKGKEKPKRKKSGELTHKPNRCVVVQICPEPILILTITESFSLKASAHTTSSNTSLDLTSLTTGHPNFAKWPPWMVQAVKAIVSLCDHIAWQDMLQKWLEFEHRMQYPTGQVSK